MAEALEAPLRVTVQLEPQGYRAVLLHLSALKLRLVVPLMAFFGFGALAAGFNSQAFFLIGGIVAIVLTVWGYIAWNVSSPSNVSLYAPTAYEFGDERITYAGSYGAGEIPWERVAKWRYAAGHYQLFVGGARYLLVPEKDLAEETPERFERMLRAKVRKGPRRVMR